MAPAVTRQRYDWQAKCSYCSAWELSAPRVVTPLINPRRTCVKRVTVVVLCVCMSVTHMLFWQYARLIIKSVTKDTFVLNVRFAAIL